MKITLMCPTCSKQGNYFNDKKLENRGYYSFRCECGEEYISPMDNPDIETTE